MNLVILKFAKKNNISSHEIINQKIGMKNQKERERKLKLKEANKGKKFKNHNSS